MVIYSRLSEKRTSLLEQILEVRDEIVLDEIAEIRERIDSLRTEEEITWLYITGFRTMTRADNLPMPIWSKARLETIEQTTKELKQSQQKIWQKWKWEQRELHKAISNQRLY